MSRLAVIARFRLTTGSRVRIVVWVMASAGVRGESEGVREERVFRQAALRGEFAPCGVDHGRRAARIDFMSRQVRQVRDDCTVDEPRPPAPVVLRSRLGQYRNVAEAGK